jgi:hypothetical protein
MLETSEVVAFAGSADLPRARADPDGDVPSLTQFA